MDLICRFHCRSERSLDGAPRRSAASEHDRRRLPQRGSSDRRSAQANRRRIGKDSERGAQNSPIVLVSVFERDGFIKRVRLQRLHNLFQYSLTMAARSPVTRRGFRKPMKILDYGKQECMNAINNNTPKVSARKQAEAFGIWLRKLLDEDRNDIGLYLADDCVLRWFGRTVKSKKDVSGFLKYDMSFSIHHFVSIHPGDASRKEIRSARYVSFVHFYNCLNLF